MNDIWGIAIPGLAMKADELPDIDGLLRLENPEIGSGPDWAGRDYSLIDVAAFHAENIAKLNIRKVVVIGMSMGGMIASIIASNFRHLLPEKSSFRLLVTSANIPDSPAITAKMLQEWSTARRGDFESYKNVLSPFFSNHFAASEADIVDQYFAYRATGGNKQSTKNLFRQIHAILNFDGCSSWSQLNPAEVTVVGGGDDRVLGPVHTAGLRQIAPLCTHYEIADLGHMVNLERPDLFKFELKL